MKSVEKSTEIKGSVNRVFEALANPENQMKFDGDMMRSCEKISEGPIGKGTRFRGDFRGMGKMEYEYSEFTENSLIEHAVRMPFGSMKHRFRFEPTSDGTRLTQTIVLKPNIIGQIMWPLAMKGMTSKRMQTLNGLLKQYVES
jgi:uncharacterized protein YndB with AHSA1/START domain